MDFTYSKLFLSFGLDKEENNKLHIDVQPFIEDPLVLAEVFAVIADTVINQLPEKDQIAYENNLIKKFKTSMKDRHELLDVKRTEL